MKYFFFDVDGTLTNIHTGEMVPSALRTIQQLQKNHFVAIATGRAYYKAKKAMEQAGIHHMVANGGACLVIDDQVVENKPLDREKALAIIKEADALGYGLLIATDDSEKVVMKDKRFIETVGERQEPTKYILQEDLDFNTLEDIYKIYIGISEEEENNLTLLDTLGHLRFVKDYLMYQHDAKDQGIKEMVTRMGGQLSDVVVFGDGANDMVMFKKEWTSIAMGDGYEALKQKADFVTEASYNDGIEKACRHFKWIK